jgi:hypothetical protein
LRILIGRFFGQWVAEIRLLGVVGEIDIVGLLCVTHGDEIEGGLFENNRR